MTDTPTLTPGHFCWIDLGAHDAAAAKRFYTALFGWTAADNQYGPTEGDVYTTYQLGGRAGAPSYPMDADQKARGMPASWLPYVAGAGAGAGAPRASGRSAAIGAGRRRGMGA